ncbi:double-strand break repair protein AddB [Rhodobacteraceae bacterium 2CG4]|uniref:Double-strand break repair protein AddB n=1 Tax=Halovulum marinum TaxID=2662447 RepID=A0A6L5YZY8_9RHOB|nr:double-strand break repair protein AddB [Halovulum marinum]MSU89432.1 double-strand break repair protein AddB [Halovulum marinum]
MPEPLLTPGVYGLPPGVDFAAEVLAGLRARTAGLPAEDCARIELWVNTERARRRLLALLEDRPVGLPPRIRALSELVDDAAGLPPVMPPLKRRLELARLVRALIAAAPDTAGRAAAYPLAEGLAELLSEMHIEGVAFGAVAGLDAPDDAGHWQRALSFLRLIRDVLEAPEAAGADPDRRMVLAMAARAARWAAAPPRHPVLVAGSTGSRGATAGFMRTVAALPQGAVILPGLDVDLPRQVWQRLDDPRHAADHPQFGLAAFCRDSGLEPWALPRWTDTPPPSPPRAALLSLALRPAPVTDQWLAEGPGLTPTLGAATAGLTLLEAADPQAEAQAVALILREAVADGVPAALVTPDRTLARRVTAALDRWGIVPDDSAGRPLDLTPPGTFLRLCAQLLTAPPDPVTLAALLKHPLCAAGQGARGAHLEQVGPLELKVLRDGGPVVTPQVLRAWADRGDAARRAWIDWLAPLLAPPLRDPAPLRTLVERHLALATALAAGPGGADPGPLWQQDAGRKAEAAMADLLEHAEAGGALEPGEYPALLRGVLAGVSVPPAPYRSHPGVAIWGTLEARTQSAPLTILGGLNEGIWPRLPRPDPWLSRDMRAASGLPLPERQIGLSAHDFQQAVGRPRVVLSRALRDGEAPTVPARWLLRLTNLAEGLDPGGAVPAMRARGARYLDIAARLDDAPRLPPAPRPAPRPPGQAFPESLSVTRIETLVRDPYALYAANILRLKPLPPLARAADALLRGISLHAVMARFLDETRAALPADAAALLTRLAAQEMAAAVPWPASRVIWRQRLAGIAPWLAETETARRAVASPWLHEELGEVAVTPLPRPFRLRAQADRVDRDESGAVAIYDYKTGNLPSRNEAAQFNQQLPLEAGIALRGGFRGHLPRAVAALQLIGLKGQELDFACDTDSLNETWDRFREMVAAYQSGELPYPARLRPRLLRDSGDYDQLARRGEWADGDPWTAEDVA